MTPTLTTDRLTLGPLTMAHFEAFAAYVGGERRAAWDSCAANAGQWVLRGYGPFWVSETATGAPVGRVGLWHPITYDRPELAWTVYPAFEGQSLAFEAAVAARQWASAHGLPPLVSYIAPDNARSIALAQRMGTTQIAHRADGALSFEHPQGLTIPTLDSARLTMGGPTPAWIDALAGFIASDRARWFHRLPAEGPEGLLEPLRQTWATGMGPFCLYLRDGTPAGFFALWHPKDRPEPGLSWLLFDGIDGRGLIAEAAPVIARYALAHSDIRSATAHVALANPRSARVAEKLGGVVETEFDKSGQPHRRYRHDIALMGALA